jgi:NADH:ubiquinone oxidoreductase subunit 6 (subunit J)
MGWVFALVTVAASLFAAFAPSFKRMILSLWIAGLGVGAFYLTLGSEFLAIIQWIVSTVVAMSFLFFSVTFGETDAAENVPLRERLLPIASGALIGIAFVAVVSLGYYKGEFREVAPSASAGEGPADGAGADLLAIGRSLTRDHLLSLELLAATLFVVLVGGHVIARPGSSSEDALGNASASPTRGSDALPSDTGQRRRAGLGLFTRKGKP